MELLTRWQNSAGERVRIALHLKGLDYTYVPVSSLAPGEYGFSTPRA
jgi:glutathione S-transferase